MPRLTVMMPALNAEATVGAAVRSTLRALPRDSELVIFDDGSTDTTVETALTVADPRVRVMSAVSSVGGGEARRRVMDATDSEFIASMDADDICYPWRFITQIPMLATSDVAFGSAIWFGRGVGDLRLKSPTAMTAEESRIALLFHCPFAHPTMVARRAVVEANGGYSPLRRAQDYELWLRLAADGARLSRTGCYVLGYRQSDNQVIRQSGFLRALRADPTLWASYRKLALEVTGSSHWDVQSLVEIDDQTRTTMFAELGALASHMRLTNRRRYRQYASKQVATLIGPVQQ